MGLIQPGAGPPSTTARPNYVSPPTHPPAMQVICILLLVLVTVSLALRLYANGRIKRQFMLDDLFATAAMLLTDASLVIQMLIVLVFHQNRHTWDIPPHTLYEGQKWVFIYDIMFSQAACQSKLSLLFFVHKMIGTPGQGTFYPHYICLIALIVVVALCQVMFVVVSCVACRPLKAFWDPHPTYPHKCFNVDIYLSIAGIVNTLTDFLCTLLPAFVVFKVHMPFLKRMGVASLFLFGIVVNIASALRIYFTYCTTKDSDTWTDFSALICGGLEIGLGSLCINLPIIRPLITQYIKYAISRIRARSSSSGSSSVTFYANKTKYHEDAYGTSHRSNTFVPVGDGSRAAAAATPTNHGRPQQA